MLESDLINSTSSWPFVEIRKLLKDRKEIIKKKKIKLLFRQAMAQADCHISELLVRFQEPQ